VRRLDAACSIDGRFASRGSSALNHTTARANATPTTSPPFDVEAIRGDFPTLQRQVHGQRLAYLDSAATTQKPEPVLRAVDDFYRRHNANVHRAVHTLSAEATEAYENARQTVARFINAPSPEEIVFLRGTTEAINLIAQAFARPRLQPGDEILLTEMEHHANIVPWQIVCQQTGATLNVAPINDRGELLIDDFESRLNDRTAIVAVGHVSNALGTINPIQRIVRAAHAHDVPVVVDGAQAAPHMPVDVQALDCDFYAFSGHKTFGPTGIGALYGKYRLLEQMPPYQGGGEMIESVTFEGTSYRKPPARFEAGTPHIAGAIGLAAAMDYVRAVGLDAIEAYERALLAQATEQLQKVAGLRLIGTAAQKHGVLSFVLEDVHAHDVATILDSCGVAVRAGHHCAQPTMRRFNVPATVRASLAFYNNADDIAALMAGLQRVREIFH
jgi:cysteine desulfurase/selenocysteine lyase